MEIGEKLREARTVAGMTQEQVAKALGVSRQTISNWETGKTWPDIVSAVRLSDLYAVSLDVLLKGDEKLMRHMEESLDAVESSRHLRRMVWWAVYLVAWVGLQLLFWFTMDPADAMGFSLLAFYLVLPVLTFVLSLIRGRAEGWSNRQWVIPLFMGGMFMLAEYASFSLANMVYNRFAHINMPELPLFAAGFLLSLLGMLLGSWVRRKQQGTEK